MRQGLRFLQAELPTILATPSDALSPRMLRLIEGLAGDWRRRKQVNAAYARSREPARADSDPLAERPPAGERAAFAHPIEHAEDRP